MEQIQICKGVKVDKIIKTRTWKKLEKHFGVPIQQIGQAFAKIQASMDIDQMIDFILVMATQDNELTRDELIEKIDNDTSTPLGVIGALGNACLMFPIPEEDEGLGKSQKDLET